MISNVSNHDVAEQVRQLLSCQLEALPFPATIRATWLAEGVVQLLPVEPWQQATVISAGIHGNETAPVEIVLRILNDISRGEQRLRQALLIVFGNLPAMRSNRRYLHSDMNRLFGARHQQSTPGNESRRAAQLEQAVARFFVNTSQLATSERMHVDLHTAIRGSRYRQFSLIPLHRHPYRQDFFRFLEACAMDAAVQHTSPGGTFSNFTSDVFAAQSCTLELGKALPFGHNDLHRFTCVEMTLRALIARDELPLRRKAPVRYFSVFESIIKTDEHFILNLSHDEENFTELEAGYEIASQPGKTWTVSANAPFILFPNAGVAIGLRAVVLLQPGSPCLSMPD